MIVLDTSVVIDHLRASRKATEFLARQVARREELVVPAVAAWELWRGASSPARLASVDGFLGEVTIDPLGASVARLAAQLHLAQRAAGRERSAYDTLIAAHALFHRAPLATMDRDYEDIPGLDLLKVSRG